MSLRSATSLALAHGTCALIELVEGDDALEAAIAALPVDEQQRARGLGPGRRPGYVAGRTALHRALAAHPHDDRDAHAEIVAAAIPSSDRGAPLLPAGWVGSTSHKAHVAAALVAPAGDATIGVDVEVAAPTRIDIARRVLTPRELAVVPDRGRAVTLRFSIKEAIYKALDPHLRRYIGFLEVELDFRADDSIEVVTALPFDIDVSWREHAGHWLSTARARPR